MALAITGTGNGSLNNLALSANTGTIVDTGRAGGIVQVVQETTTTTVQVATATFTDTGLSTSITPNSSSNKILVTVYQPFNMRRDVAGVGLGVRLVRDSTTIIEPPIVSASGSPLTWWVSNSLSMWGTIQFTYLDSPATTSSTTYKTAGRPYFTTNNGRVDFQRGSSEPSIYSNGSTSVITLMEVVA